MANVIITVFWIDNWVVSPVILVRRLSFGLFGSHLGGTFFFALNHGEDNAVNSRSLQNNNKNLDFVGFKNDKLHVLKLLLYCMSTTWQDTSLHAKWWWLWYKIGAHARDYKKSSYKLENKIGFFNKLINLICRTAATFSAIKR